RPKSSACSASPRLPPKTFDDVLRPSEPRRIGEEHFSKGRGAFSRDGNMNATARIRDTGADEQLRFVSVALELLDVGRIHEPVAMNAHERPSERALHRRQRKVDVERTVRRMDAGESIGGFECPYLL